MQNISHHSDVMGVSDLRLLPKAYDEDSELEADAGNGISIDKI